MEPYNQPVVIDNVSEEINALSSLTKFTKCKRCGRFGNDSDITCLCCRAVPPHFYRISFCWLFVWLNPIETTNNAMR